MKRKITHVLPFIALIFISLNINAQDNLSFDVSPQGSDVKEKKGFFKWVDNILAGNGNYDTTYMGNPYGKFSISLFQNFTRHHNYLITNGDASQIRNKVAASTGVGFSYRGVGIGLSVNFKQLSGKSKDSDFYIRLYSRSIGGDLHIFNVGNFYDVRYKSDLSYTNYLSGVRINLYYIFNNKKFSYSSGFSYSRVQKKSAGSVIATMSFYSDNLSLGFDNDYYKEIINYYYNDFFPNGNNGQIQDTTLTTLTGCKTQYLSLGAGYAYNIVPYKNWLINLSIEPSLLLWQKRTLNFDEVNYHKDPGSEIQVSSENLEPVTAPYYFFNFCCNGKAGISYWWKRFYVGAYYITTMNFINLKGETFDNRFGGKTVTISRWWNARLTVGFRF